MDSGRLFAEYCKAMKEPAVDRVYRKLMKRMEESGLVKSDRSGRWKRYHITRVV
jgi:Cdc6-like AAA superfamily ATPase